VSAAPACGFDRLNQRMAAGGFDRLNQRMAAGGFDRLNQRCGNAKTG